MKPYLQKLWRTRKRHIVSLATLLVVTIYLAVINSRAISPSDYGIGVGTALALVLFLGPVVVIDLRGVKVRSPRPVFVEPSQWGIGLLFVITDVILAVVIFGITSIEPISSYMDRALEADGFAAGLIMMPLILSFILAPAALYSIIIKTRYKRIVEYNTAEWRRLRKK